MTTFENPYLEDFEVEQTPRGVFVWDNETISYCAGPFSSEADAEEFARDLASERWADRSLRR
ncbi:MAG: hypothetical protein ACE5HV_00055 [Acidobacteriota bacterium]